MAPFKAGVEGSELDRDSRRNPESAFRFFRNAVEGRPVGFGVAFGIFERLCRLTKHVETVAEALAALRLGTLQRFADVAAEHEVAAEDLHRLADCGADHR